MRQIQPVILLPQRGPRVLLTDEEAQIDLELIHAINSWFRTHGVRLRGDKHAATNGWVNRYSNATYKDFRSMVESLIVLITKINMLQLTRRRLSPLSRLVAMLQVFLIQTHQILGRKHQLRAWQQRGWITRDE